MQGNMNNAQHIDAIRPRYVFAACPYWDPCNTESHDPPMHVQMQSGVDQMCQPKQVSNAMRGCASRDVCEFEVGLACIRQVRHNVGSQPPPRADLPQVGQTMHMEANVSQIADPNPHPCFCWHAIGFMHTRRTMIVVSIW